MLHADFDLGPLRGYYLLFGGIDATKIHHNAYMPYRFCGDLFLFRLDDRYCDPENLNGTLRFVVYDDVPFALLNSRLFMDLIINQQWKVNQMNANNVVRLGFYRMLHEQYSEPEKEGEKARRERERRAREACENERRAELMEMERKIKERIGRDLSGQEDGDSQRGQADSLQMKENHTTKDVSISIHPIFYIRPGSGVPTGQSRGPGQSLDRSTSCAVSTKHQNGGKGNKKNSNKSNNNNHDKDHKNDANHHDDDNTNGNNDRSPSALAPPQTSAEEARSGFKNPTRNNKRSRATAAAGAQDDASLEQEGARPAKRSRVTKRPRRDATPFPDA